MPTSVVFEITSSMFGSRASASTSSHCRRRRQRATQRRDDPIAWPPVVAPSTALDRRACTVRPARSARASRLLPVDEIATIEPLNAPGAIRLVDELLDESAEKRAGAELHDALGQVERPRAAARRRRRDRPCNGDATSSRDSRGRRVHLQRDSFLPDRDLAVVVRLVVREPRPGRDVEDRARRDRPRAAPSLVAPSSSAPGVEVDPVRLLRARSRCSTRP